jgi:hypothetical protein
MEMFMSFMSGHIRDITTRHEFHTSPNLRCDWKVLRSQLLQQWSLLSENDLDMTGPDATRISSLIERKYGISATMIENYLQKFVRTMPLQ